MVTIIHNGCENCMGNARKHLLEINKSTRVAMQGQMNGERVGVSENFTWQVKWKFLHKSKLKVLKIAKGLKLNFTILTCAQGEKREVGRERGRDFPSFFWLCYLDYPLLTTPSSHSKEGPVNLYALLLLFRRFVLLFTCWIFQCVFSFLFSVFFPLAFIFIVCCVCPLGKFLVACWFSNLR